MEVLIERDCELAALAEVVDAAVAGRGGAVLAEGEAGIGKTRLLAFARARAAAAGARVLYAIADEPEASVPLAGGGDDGRGAVRHYAADCAAVAVARHRAPPYEIWSGRSRDERGGELIARGDVQLLLSGSALVPNTAGISATWSG